MQLGSVEKLYKALIAYWNSRDAKQFAALFRDEGMVIGFDGSMMKGTEHIQKELTEIFQSHPTGKYVWKIKDLIQTTSDTAILYAIAAIVPQGKDGFNPATGAQQLLTAIQQQGGWKIALFQNTPAQFHGRPEMAAAFNKELSEPAINQV